MIDQKFLDAIVNLGNHFKEMNKVCRELLQKQIDQDKKIDKLMDLVSAIPTKPMPVISAPTFEAKPEIKIEKPKPRKVEEKIEEKIIAATEKANEGFDDFDNIPKASIPGFPVQQRVCKSTGKSLFMASVSIFKNGEEKFKTKTKAPNGIWQASLEPGDYIIKIRKQEVEGVYLSEQAIKMPSQSLQLDTAVITPTKNDM